MQRNFSLAAWAIRKHLDYVSRFSFQSKTDDEDFNQQVEDFLTTWSMRVNCDVAKRHRLSRFVRLLEAMRTIDGDVFALRTSRGQLQAIESDRVRSPDGTTRRRRGDTRDPFVGRDMSRVVHGIEVAPAGAPKNYLVWDRDNVGGYVFKAVVPARFMFSHGYYTRFDQVRGISPLASALNSMQDVYEGIDYALAKAKIAQLFALTFFRDQTDQLDGTTATQDTDDDGVPDAKYEFDPTAGPAILDLDPGDRAEIMESKQPSAEFRDFLNSVIMLAIKSLDIPFSLYDESFTNFYGSRGGLIQYIKSAKSKREDVREFLDDVTRWRLNLAILDGDLILPRGTDASFLKWEWTPDGVPWWDPVKEVKGNREAVAAGFTTPQRVCKETDSDFFDNVEDIATAQKFAEDRGVALSFVPEPETIVEVEGGDNA